MRHLLNNTAHAQVLAQYGESHWASRIGDSQGHSLGASPGHAMHIIKVQFTSLRRALTSVVNHMLKSKGFALHGESPRAKCEAC